MENLPFAGIAAFVFLMSSLFVWLNVLMEEDDSIFLRFLIGTPLALIMGAVFTTALAGILGVSYLLYKYLLVLFKYLSTIG